MTETQHIQLQQFFNQSQFEKRGAVVTDLDGTAIHEYQGQLAIPQSVELGLMRVYELGRPVVINTLRFPKSVIRTFGKEWYKLSNAAIPTVLMNGSQMGNIIQLTDGSFAYEEIASFPLEKDEIKEPFTIIEKLVSDGVDDILAFYYPRNWELGEIIWTPVQEKLPFIADKYKSASEVYSSSLGDLKIALDSQDICMIFLLIDIPQDKLMAYQHSKRENFYTHKGVDKKSGVEHIAKHLGFELHHSIGAGDSIMDNFLESVGLAIHVGNPFLTFEGVVPSLKLNSSSEFGELLFELAAMQRNVNLSL